MSEPCNECGEEEAVYECLGCQLEPCPDCHSRGLCVNCQGYTLRGNYDIENVRAHGGEPKFIKESK